jgi:DNA topoisomerase-1
MPKSLLIVESPTKAKTLARFLGKDFIVKASVGHVKDLPKNRLGIDIGHQFLPEYQTIHGKKKVLAELNAAAARAQAIYLGPDPDREGEAIAWHIAEELDPQGKPVYRVLFHELTHKAIQEALARPEPLNRSLFEAQQSRRILDRLVGYLISPLLWEKVKRGLSAGRVQSVALRLVCERERDIQRFESEEYWTISARLTPAAPFSGEAGGGTQGEAGSLVARLWRCQKQKCKIPSAAEAQRIIEMLRSASYRVSKVDRKNQKRHPAPPFITSTLQQEAARKLRFSAKRTMNVAQRLYEGMEVGAEGAVGLITYMRTDSTRIAGDAAQAVRDFIMRQWGKPYLPAKANQFKNKKGAQDAHEAIRPTDVERTPEAVAVHLSKEQLALYTLIWKRFVACQMTPAVIAQTTIDVEAAGFVLRATGSTVQFPGFMSVYVETAESDEAAADTVGALPTVSEGQQLTLLELLPKQNFTQPPPRFSEASLIHELEEKGIGRPSTYATILSTILDKEYVRLEKQRLLPTELGLLINDLLVANFPAIVDAEFTARMEESLDAVETGQHPYVELLERFYEQFAVTVEEAKRNMLNLRSDGLKTDLDCPKCQRKLLIKASRNGPFLACSGYPKCRFTSNYARDAKGIVQLMAEAPLSETCDQCGRPMLLRQGRFGSFLACSGYPQCRNTRPVGTGLRCPKPGCDGELTQRTSRQGRRFYGCSRYPACKTAFWDRPVAELCPACGAPVLLEKVGKKSGAKLVCPNPDCRYERPLEPTADRPLGAALEG